MTETQQNVMNVNQKGMVNVSIKFNNNKKLLKSSYKGA